MNTGPGQGRCGGNQTSMAQRTAHAPSNGTAKHSAAEHMPAAAAPAPTCPVCSSIMKGASSRSSSRITKAEGPAATSSPSPAPPTQAQKGKHGGQAGSGTAKSRTSRCSQRKQCLCGIRRSRRPHPRCRSGRRRPAAPAVLLPGCAPPAHPAPARASSCGRTLCNP